MITSTWMGRLGRLGNQLFQYATLLGVSERLGYEVRLPPSVDHDLGTVVGLSVPTYTSEELRRLRHRFVQRFPSFGHEPGLADLPDDCDLYGHFQSRHHFPPDPLLRQQLALLDEHQQRADELRRSWGERPVVGMSVRRGDFVGNADYVDLHADGYYERAIAHFRDRQPLFFVGSDDPAWCRGALGLEDAVYSDGMSPGEQLALFARCDHIVLSNSTFAWWAGWYQEPNGGDTIAPKHWYSAEGWFDDAEQDRSPAWLEL